MLVDIEREALFGGLNWFRSNILGGLRCIHVQKSWTGFEPQRRISLNTSIALAKEIVVRAPDFLAAAIIVWSVFASLGISCNAKLAGR